MTRKTFLPIVIVISCATVALVLWRVQATKAKVAKREAAILKGLTEDEIDLVLKSQAQSDPEKVDAIVRDPESRRAFLASMTEHLALAASARREGMTDDSDFQLNLHLKENGLLSTLYTSKLVAEQKQPVSIGKEQLDAVWANPENDQEFKRDMEALYAVQRSAAESVGSSLGVTQRLQGEGLEKARRSWARAKILSDLARADSEFIKQPAVQLRLKILEAGVLSTSYLAKYWVTNIKATREEVAGYLVAHPEFDVRKKRERAETVLRRALAGEDFANLAKEFSEDRSTKNKGGLYADYEKGGGLWPEVENAALKLKPGEVGDKLVETKDGYHIVQFVTSTSVKGDYGHEAVHLSVRHILLQKRFEDPSAAKVSPMVPPPFKTAEEIAKAEIEKDKQRRFISRVIERERISVPSDFRF